MMLALTTGVGADRWVPPVCETARKKLTRCAAAAGWGTGLLLGFEAAHAQGENR